VAAQNYDPARFRLHIMQGLNACQFNLLCLLKIGSKKQESHRFNVACSAFLFGILYALASTRSLPVFTRITRLSKPRLCASYILCRWYYTTIAGELSRKILAEKYVSSRSKHASLYGLYCALRFQPDGRICRQEPCGFINSPRPQSTPVLKPR
jgi:hypothetical protein